MKTLLPSFALASLLTAASGLAQAPGELLPDQAPISTLLQQYGDEVRVFDEHVVFLANPFLQGRLPGTPGMAVAEDYIEHHLREAGLEPAFGNSYRQPFGLGDSREVLHQRLSVAGVQLAPDVDFVVTGFGGGGKLDAPLTFAGYGITAGPEGYSSFAEGDSLKGRIAFAFRFEPIDAEGKSRWAEGRQPWSAAARNRSKFQALQERGAEAIILVNPPGAADPRAHRLMEAGGGGGVVDIPVILMSTDAAQRVLQAVGSDHSLTELRQRADQGSGGLFDFGATAQVDAGMKEEKLIAHNVGGLLPGRGALAGELVVLGAHIDHLGLGKFGSRVGARGILHPGADDNASGTAAILMMAKALVADYAALPAGADARSILFIGFSAEESGLNGSRHYVQNPIRPLADHAFMINFDMIGRVNNHQLQIQGAHNAKGMADWLKEYCDKSSLEVRMPKNMNLGSDHLMFNSRGVPAIMGIIDAFHGDYHTPEDQSWKLNRVGAVEVIHLFTEILKGAALSKDRFHTNPSG